MGAARAVVHIDWHDFLVVCLDFYLALGQRWMHAVFGWLLCDVGDEQVAVDAAVQQALAECWHGYSALAYCSQEERGGDRSPSSQDTKSPSSQQPPHRSRGSAVVSPARIGRGSSQAAAALTKEGAADVLGVTAWQQDGKSLLEEPCGVGNQEGKEAVAEQQEEEAEEKRRMRHAAPDGAGVHPKSERLAAPAQARWLDSSLTSDLVVESIAVPARAPAHFQGVGVARHSAVDRPAKAAAAWGAQANGGSQRVGARGKKRVGCLCLCWGRHNVAD
jgi:hypothetical protein